MKKRLIVLSSVGLAVVPFLAFGAGVGMCSLITSPIQRVLCTIQDILNTIVPILIVLGVIYFVWGVVSYVIGTDEETKKTAKSKIIYGIIGLVVIVGMWGLVGIVMGTFGLGNNTTGIEAPCVPGSGNPNC